ncbi:hypothetical protein F2Q70_00030782 [Brassica cretica]|uniref:Uncharacterized protein n=1 Tax=Brassica cretica TaxID=69181 RepID=A0A8S9FPD2_BRACR|nr:hypothetical protein F2Q70_00030782 [Brassica cretica]
MEFQRALHCMMESPPLDVYSYCSFCKTLVSCLRINCGISFVMALLEIQWRDSCMHKGLFSNVLHLLTRSLVVYFLVSPLLGDIKEPWPHVYLWYMLCTYVAQGRHFACRFREKTIWGRQKDALGT